MGVEVVERAIIKTIIEDALDQGYVVAHHDGEEYTAYSLGMGKATATDRIMEELYATDEEFLVFFRGRSKAGWVKLVYGNDGHDVVADHTDSQEIERLLSGAMELADYFEGRHEQKIHG